MQIRNKLTFRFALLVGSFLFAFALVIYLLSANYRKQEFNQRLKERAVNTAKLLIDVKEINNDLLRIIDSSNYSALIGDEVIVFDYFKKSKIYSSAPLSSISIDEDLLSKIRTEGEYTFRQGHREAIGLLYSSDFRRFVVISSAIDIYGVTKLQNLMWVLTIGYIISIAFIILIGRNFARQSLRPIVNVISEVSSIGASNLGQRLNEGNGHDEIAKLAITFNKMLDRLETAFKMQKSFVSSASHELRTPLASITSQIEVVLMKSRTEKEYREVLVSVLDEARGLTSLSNNLLEIARSEQDTATMTIGKVRLDEVLLETQADILAARPKAVIDIDVSDNTEDEDHELYIQGNENLLRLVFINLIDNACKFSDNSPVKVLVEFRERNVLIKVDDNGIGIAPADLPHIFEPFYRAQNAESRKGHGIGLSLIYKIIKLHNGNIQVLSEVGKGTTVEVTLPYRL